MGSNTKEITNPKNNNNSTFYLMPRKSSCEGCFDVHNFVNTQSILPLI